MATIHTFGPFRLDADAKILFRGDEPAVMGQRAVALLGILLQRAGTPVSKDALIEAAWPGLAIEDSNLTVQIAALRRVFEEVAGGASWIETLPRRGYRYVGPPVSTGNPPAEANSRTSPALALPDKPSIAVLPFSNLSGDPEQEYFADGMVDDIITGLSRIKWLFVIARNSTFAYKGRAVDVKQVGRDLGVRYVLEGSVRKAADRVRITGQLIDAATGAHVWAERYDRKFDEIFALQDEIALSVVGMIGPSLRQAEVERVKRKRPENLDAYDLVLQAQPDVYSGMPERVTKALVLLERALALDPTYALAHAFAAMCHHCLFLRAGLHEEERTASIRHARAAIVHGQDDALALTFAGFSIGMDGHDHAAAFAALEAALAVSPSSALTYIVGGVIFGWAGKAERAIEWGERAMRLSPFDPWAWSAFHSLTLGHFHRGRYEEAANAAHKAVQFNPGHSISHMLLAAPLAKLGRLEESKAAAARVLELQPAFRYSRQFAGVDCAPALAASLGEALRATGLPE
jgi:TolB-like protein/tetratricopeptide (TPR) repeat protein